LPINRSIRVENECGVPPGWLGSEPGAALQGFFRGNFPSLRLLPSPRYFLRKIIVLLRASANFAAAFLSTSSSSCFAAC
jgi:hypothetical protein